MYFFTFLGRPRSTEQKEVSGAYINCWIDLQNISDAKILAEQKILEHDWEILKMEDGYIIDRADYNYKKEGLQYFEEALIDKWVLVFHTYPNE